MKGMPRRLHTMALERNGSWRLRAAHFPQQLDCVQRALGRLFMFEVGKDIAPFRHVLPDAFDHRAPLFPAVAGLTKAVVDETCGRDVGSSQGFRFSYAQCHVVRFEQVPSGVGEPGGISELEGRRNCAREYRQEVLEQCRVRLQVRWKLEQDWAEFARGGQRFNRRQESRNEVFGSLQPLDVRDDLVRLNAEPKMRRRVLHPVPDRGFLDELPKGEIYFDGIELGRIVTQEFLLRQLGRVKIGLPCRVSPSGGPSKKLAHDFLCTPASSRIISALTVFVASFYGVSAPPPAPQSRFSPALSHLSLSDPAVSASIRARVRTDRPSFRSGPQLASLQTPEGLHLSSWMHARLLPTSRELRPWDARARAMNTRPRSSCARRSGSSRRRLSRCAPACSSPTARDPRDRARATAPARAKTFWSLRRSLECLGERRSEVPSSRTSSENFLARSVRISRAARTQPGNIAQYLPAARDRDRTPSRLDT